MGDDEEEYRGPAVVVVGGTEVEVEVEVHVAGHFDPLTGAYRWTGRIAADPAVSAARAAGTTAVRIRTPGGHEGEGVLGDPNLWGGHPVSGTGRPPFPVPEVDPTED
jgi:hypothetical protein